VKIERKKKFESNTDALEIIDQEFYHGKPERVAELEQMRADDAVARKIYDLRTKAGLTQRQLATMIGTTRRRPPPTPEPKRW